MQGKLEKGKYKTFADMIKDIKTLVANAKTYNEPESEVHRDAQLINVCSGGCPLQRNLNPRLQLANPSPNPNAPLCPEPSFQTRRSVLSPQSKRAALS